MSAAVDDTDRVLHVDPNTLVIGTNARETVTLRPEFVASVKERGVLQPITAYRGPDGALTVDMGQRRTLAAIKAKRATVPVIVVPSPDDRDRIVDQLTENIHRDAMTTTDITRGVEQLAVFGLSEAQIAKKTAIPKEAVNAALRAAKSKTATAAAAENANLTLEHTAAIAEFEDDPDTVEKLVDGAQRGGFAHTLQRARDDRAEKKARHEFSEKLRAEGHTVVDPPVWRNDNEGPRRLSSLVDVDVADHAANCPGHAVCVGYQWVYVWVDTGERVDQEPVEVEPADEFGDDLDDEEPADEPADAEVAPRQQKQTRLLAPDPVCIDPPKYGHKLFSHNDGAAPQKGPMTEAQKKERRELIENNKAWKSASTYRREWLFEFAKRKNTPAGAELFVYRELLHTPHQFRNALDGWGKGAGHQSFRDVMGLDREANPSPHVIQKELGELLAASDTVTPKRATLLTAAMVLTAWHHTADTNTWRDASPTDVRVLRQMQTWGYPLAEVEQLALTRYERKHAELDAKVAEMAGESTARVEAEDADAEFDEDAAEDE